MTFDKQYQGVLASLKLAAAPYAEQQRLLPDFADVSAEVASDLEDSFLLLPGLIRNGFFTQEAIAAILACYVWVNVALRNEPRAYEASYFEVGAQWEKVRALAADALATIAAFPAAARQV